MKKRYIFAFILLTFSLKQALGQTITLGSLPATLCANESFDVPITLSGFSLGNSMVAQLSSADGTFPATPTVIGTANVNSDGLHYIQVQIPASTTFSATYQIRVSTAALPGVISTASGNININCTSNDYYWVGGTGNWTNLGHWASISGGSANAYTNAPTTNDNVYFDSNSFPSGGQVTLDVEAYCNDMVWSDGSTNPILYGNYNNPLHVRGDFILVNGVNRNLNYLYLESDKQNVQLDLADNLYNTNPNVYWRMYIYFYNGGDWNLNSDMIGIQSFQLYDNGTVHSNSHNFEGYDFYLPNGTYYAGSSTITTSSFNVYDAFNAETSTIELYNPDGNETQMYGSQTLNNVVVKDRLSYFASSNTIANLSLENGGGINLNNGTTQTITSSFSALGNGRSSLAVIKSNNPGNPATLYVAGASVSADYVDIADDIIDDGIAGIYTATNAVNSGNNTNWNFSLLTPLDYYWINGNGNWSDISHWQTSSDGVNFTAAAEAPGPIDNVRFTTNSFPSGGTINIDQAVTVNDFFWESGSGASTPTIYGDYGNRLTVRGDITIDSGVKRNIYQLTIDSSNGLNQVDLGDDINAYGNITFEGGGSWDLVNDLYTSQDIYFNAGTLNTNDYSMSSNYLQLNGNDPLILNFGSSTINITYDLYAYGNNLTLNAGTSTLYFGDLNNFNTVYLENYTNGNITFNNVVGRNQFRVFGDNTFNSFSAEPGTTIEIENTTIQTITGNLTLQGSRSKFISVTSNSAGTPATFYVFGASITADFVDITDNSINDGVGGIYNATNAVDGGGNTGWSFSALVPLDYRWIGGTGNWNDATHWESSTVGANTYSATSDAPAYADNIFFDTNSFPSGGTISLNANYQCNDMTWEAGSGASFPVIYSDYTLSINGSLKLVDGVTRNLYRIEFSSSNMGNTIDLADNLNNGSDIDFTGLGEWTLMSDLNTRYLNLRDGTLNTNDYTVNVERQIYLDSNHSGIVNWGSSIVNLQDFYSDSPAIDFQAQSSTFNFTTTSSSCSINGGYPVSFNDVVVHNDFFLSNSYTFNNLTFNPGIKVEIEGGVTQTINNSFTVEGTRSQMVDIKSMTNGSPSTFVINTGLATLSVNYAIIQDNILDNGSGFTNTEIASNSLDKGNNIGWDFSTSPLTSLDYYWIGGTGNWSDLAHWASTDGGSTLQADSPGPLDNIFFTSNSFPVGGTITLDIPASCNNMTWNDGSLNPTISGDYENRLTISGNLTIADGVNRNLDYIEFNSTGSNLLIDLGDNQFESSTLNFSGGGTWNLLGPVEADYINFYEGTLNTNDQYLDLYRFGLDGSDPISINLGSSEIYTQYIRNYASNTSIDVGTSHIFLEDGGQIYSNPVGAFDLTIEGNASIYSELNISNNLTIEPGANLMISPSYTLSVTNLIANGTRPSPVTIKSTDEGIQSTISQSSGTVNAQHIILIDNNATGGATFNATDAYDKGNVTGWNITPIAPIDYYWVAANGDWSDKNSWSLADGSNVAPATAPGPADNVFVTTNSSIVSGGNMNLDIPADCNDMTWMSGITGASISGNNITPLTIHGSLTTIAGVQLNLDKVIFDSDNSNTIDIGSNTGNLYFDTYFKGVGDWTLVSDFYCGYMSFQGGALYTNGFTAEIDNIDAYSSTGAGLIDFGSSDIYTFRLNANNIGINAGTSTLYLDDNATVYNDFNFNDVEIDGEVSFYYGDNSFNTLTVWPGSTVRFYGGSTQTVNQLNAVGERSRPITIQSTSEGNEATISQSSGFVTGEYLILQDNIAAGGANFAAQNSIDNGNVSGWYITPISPLNYYWVGGTGSWSESSTHWVNADNGSTFYAESPGQVDNVFFTANSFTSDGTLTLDNPVSVDNMDWTGNTSLVSISDGGDDANSLTIGGSLTLANGVSRDFEDLFFNSDKIGNTIFMADNLYSNNFIYFDGFGDWALTGDYDTYYTEFNGGTFYTDNYDFGSQYIRLYNSNVSYWGSSDVYTWRFYNSLNDPNNFNSETSIFHFDEINNNYITGNSRFYITLFNGDTYVDGSNIFYNSSFTMGTLQLDGSQAFNSLTMEGGTILSLLEGTTHTISAALDLNGEINTPVIVNSFTYSDSDPGVATISSPPAGAISANYIHLKNNTATGGANFTATNSSDFGNVTGWNGLLMGQTIDFSPLDDIPLSNGSFNIGATASSSLGVSFEIASGSATLSGTTVTPSASGLVGIRAVQAGDATYGSALPVTQYVHIDATEESNELGNMKEAKFILGQPDATSNESFFTNTSTPGPYQVAVSSTGQMAVSQRRRLLIWNKIPDNSTTQADVVIGQVDFDSSDDTAPASASSFSPAAGNPTAYSVQFSNSGKLIVSDYNRVLIWNTIPTTNNTPADIVLGQQNFNSTNNSISESEYGGGVITATTYYDGGSGNEKLIVSDPGNNRVLIYNSIPTASFTAANVVIGQPDFYSNSSGNGADQLFTPEYCSVSSDGKLLIADFRNNRVVGFNSIPTSNGASADFMLGQADFGSSDSGVGSNSFYGPYGLSISRTNKLAITDFYNNRVLIYNTIPTNNTVPPDYVLGQPDANSNETPEISGRTMLLPVNANWDLSENLFVSDRNNNRVLLYGAADLEGPNLSATPLETYDMGGTNQVASFTADDRSGIANGTVFFNTINQLDPTATPQFYEQTALTDAGNGVYELDFNSLGFSSPDLIGFEYYVELYDNLGNVTSTLDNGGTPYVAPVYYDTENVINGYGVGTTTESYRIMAVPLSLDDASVSSVFGSVLGGSTYDNTKLRVFEYQGGASDYSEASGSTQLVPGNGYFALVASNPGSISPAGTTSFVTSDAGNGNNLYEFTLDLVPGWNLIGNPFPHNILWSDVVALSGITSEVATPQIYNGSAYVDATVLEVGEGAFVHVDGSSNFSLRIPALYNSSAGRLASPQENKNPLDDASWEVLFKSYKPNSEEEYTIGGFGMEIGADVSKDEFDVLNPPAFGSMKVVDFNHPEYSAPSFKKDIKETSEEGMWEFNYKQKTESVSKHELHWDNTYFGDNSPDLYLVDKTHFVTINMKETNSYEFMHAGETKFEVYYGDDALQQIMPNELITQSPFPNPFINEVNFTLGLPNGENYQLEIRIFDSVGKTVRYISKDDINAGYNSIIWDGLNTDGRILPGGIYAYSIHIKGAKIDSVTTGKLMKR